LELTLPLHLGFQRLYNGYVPVEEDFRDMEHFGVELPLQLRRRRPV
jgi:hypothetical protein